MGDVGSIARALRSAKAAVVENAKQDMRSLRHLRGRAKEGWLNRRVHMGSVRVEQPLLWDEATGGDIWGDAKRCFGALGEPKNAQADSICTYEEKVIDAIMSFASKGKYCAGDLESWAKAELDLKNGDEGPRTRLEERALYLMRAALKGGAKDLPDETLQYLRKRVENFYLALDRINGPEGGKLDPETVRTSKAVLGLIMEACNQRLARKDLPPHFLGPKRSKPKQKADYEKVRKRATLRAFANAVVEPGNDLVKALVSGEDPMPMINKLGVGCRVFGEAKLLHALCETFRDFRNAENPQDYFKLKTTIDQMGRRAAALLEISKNNPGLRFKAEAMKAVHHAYYLATFPPDKRDLKGIPSLQDPGAADRAWAHIRRAVGTKNEDLTSRIYAVIESVLVKNRDVAPVEKLAELLNWSDTSKIWKPLVAAFEVLKPQEVEHLRIFGATLETIAVKDLAEGAPERAKAKTLAHVAGIIASAHDRTHELDVLPWRMDESEFGPVCYQLIVRYAFGSLDDFDKYVASLKGFVNLAQRDNDAFFSAVEQAYRGRSPSDRAILLDKIQTLDAAIIGRSDLDYEIYEMSEKILDRLRRLEAVDKDVTDVSRQHEIAPPLVQNTVVLTHVTPPRFQNAVMITDPVPRQNAAVVTPVKFDSEILETARFDWQAPRPIEQKQPLLEADIRQARDELAAAIKDSDFARFYQAVQTIDAMKAEDAEKVRAVLNERVITSTRRFWGIIYATWEAVQKSPDFTDAERAEVAETRAAWSVLRAELKLGTARIEPWAKELTKAEDELKQLLHMR